jgi:hypothetical protein
MESSKTCESVRDSRRALSKHANISSWNTSSRRYSPRSSRRFMRSNDSARTLAKDWSQITKYNIFQQQFIKYCYTNLTEHQVREVLHVRSTSTIMVLCVDNCFSNKLTHITVQWTITEYRFLYVTNCWVTNNLCMRIDSGQSELVMNKIKLQTGDWQWSSMFSTKNVHFHVQNHRLH